MEKRSPEISSKKFDSSDVTHVVYSLFFFLILSFPILTLFFSATNNDEMCNFYLMYYVENDEPLNMKYCFSQGPPNYYWRNPDVGLNNIPHKEASTL